MRTVTHTVCAGQNVCIRNEGATIGLRVKMHVLLFSSFSVGAVGKGPRANMGVQLLSSVFFKLLPSY